MATIVTILLMAFPLCLILPEDGTRKTKHTEECTKVR